MIFTSKQVNLDPQPTCVLTTENIDSEDDCTTHEHDPRPEFEPTRDPKPYIDYQGQRHSEEEAQGGLDYAPRREQFDTPVNGYLQGMRDDVESFTYDADGYSLAAHSEFWLRCLDDAEGDPQEIDHARRVLTRLANVNKEMEH